MVNTIESYFQWKTDPKELSIEKNMKSIKLFRSGKKEQMCYIRL